MWKITRFKKNFNSLKSGKTNKLYSFNKKKKTVKIETSSEKEEPLHKRDSPIKS